MLAPSSAGGVQRILRALAPATLAGPSPKVSRIRPVYLVSVLAHSPLRRSTSLTVSAGFGATPDARASASASGVAGGSPGGAAETGSRCDSKGITPNIGTISTANDNTRAVLSLVRNI